MYYYVYGHQLQFETFLVKNILRCENIQAPQVIAAVLYFALRLRLESQMCVSATASTQKPSIKQKSCLHMSKLLVSDGLPCSSLIWNYKDV